jgi:hypothetical protein
MIFEFNGLSLDDLETAMFKITMLDHDTFGANNMIGCFVVDLSYIYKMNTNHELLKRWIAIQDPKDESGDNTAFIKLTLNVLGPGDKPPINDPSKGLKDKGDNGVSKLFTPGKGKLTGHIVKFSIFRAEHLAPLDLLTNSVDPYFKISFAGTGVESKTVDSERNPEYN